MRIRSDTESLLQALFSPSVPLVESIVQWQSSGPEAVELVKASIPIVRERLHRDVAGVVDRVVGMSCRIDDMTLKVFRRDELVLDVQIERVGAQACVRINARPVEWQCKVVVIPHATIGDVSVLKSLFRTVLTTLAFSMVVVDSTDVV